jgi:geranylgeranylglycerol-phosphate geranylgeranyltransferase
MMRIANSLMVGFAVIVGVYLAAPDLRNVPYLILLSSFAVGFLISASSMVLNDIADIEIDKVNAPERPLPSGAISKREAYVCYTILLISGLALSTLTGLDSLFVAALGAVLAALYNLRLKLSGLPGNVIVAFSTSLPFLYAFTVVDKPNTVVLVFWAMVFLAVLGREIAKDIADIEGDLVKKARTLPILLGRRAAAIVATLSYMSAVFLSPLPLLYHLVRHEDLYAVGVFIVDIILIHSSYILLRSPRKQVAIAHKREVLVAMLLGLIVFLVSNV